MEKHKVTMKDIAKKAGVSAATVSYVLNYSEKEKISHDTRIKIFRTAQELGYVPNMAAKSLASKSSHLVGIIINLSEKNQRSKLFQYYDLMNEIQRNMHRLGYDVVILSTKKIERDFDVVSKRSLDAVFVLGMGESQLSEIAHRYYVPIIFIDGYIDDALFFKIMPDYRAIFKKAKDFLKTENPYLVIEDYSNNLINEIIFQEFRMCNVFVNSKEQHLDRFLEEHKEQKGIIVGEILGVIAERYVDDQNIVVITSNDSSTMLKKSTKRFIVSNKEKAEWATTVMEKLIRLESMEDIPKSIFIQPKE